MSETKIDERGASGAVVRRRTTTVMLTVDEVRKCREMSKPPMTDIDYSRPVGWWCDECACGVDACECEPSQAVHIPRYLPIPEGQRPPAASEVEEAEVVTSYSAPSPSTPFTVVRSGNRADTVLDGMNLAATVQRIVTGATE